MKINGKSIDEMYKDWSGDHHTSNSGRPVHDSAECTDFAEYCLRERRMSALMKDVLPKRKEIKP